MNEIQRKVLERLGKVMNECDIPAILKKEGEDGYPADMLTTLHTEFGLGNDEVMGEFFFMPQEEGDTYMEFIALVNMDEELNPTFLEPLYEAVSKVNYYITGGSFGIDDEGLRLCFKKSILIPGQASEDQIFDMADICVGNALSTAEEFMDPFMSISRGEAGPEEAVSLVAGE